MADVHDAERQSPRNFGDLLDGLHRRREADALRPRPAVLRHQLIEPRQRQRQVRAALIVRHGVDLVDDHRAHVLQHLARPACGEQNVQRFRRGHQNVRMLARHMLALGLRRIAGAERGADGRELHEPLHRELRNLGQRNFEILVNVVAQRLERRDIEDLRLFRQRTQARAGEPDRRCRPETRRAFCRTQ